MGLDNVLAVAGAAHGSYLLVVLGLGFCLALPLQVVGIPKTIDNDLEGTDFSPGYPSAAKYLASSLRACLQGKRPDDWRRAMYYRYWMHMSTDHKVPAHYGVRTKTHKLVFYYGKALGATGTTNIDTPPEWELFDLTKDPGEMTSVYGDPAYAKITATLKQELARLQHQYKDQPAT